MTNVPTAEAPPRNASFRDAARHAVRDNDLREALRATTAKFVAARCSAVATLPAFEDVRTRAHDVKQHTLAQLDRYLQEFANQVEAKGGHVFSAQDAPTASDYISKLAAERGVRRVVKSKSMVTEEIGLNHALAAQGVEVTETDLGEYIVQLAGETPSHLLVPALHKTRADVGRLFAEKLGIPYSNDVATLVAAARAQLRRKFLEADMGISGANFAIAATGTLVILENEGNARLSTTLPRIHVAVIGAEKLLPRLDDLPTFLSVLARSATGQIQSVYVSLLSGMNSGGEGPQELHVVIVDNGRSRMLADHVQREALSCIRCGACLNICPVYRTVGGHAYGSVYPGPIGSLVSNQLCDSPSAADLPFASSLCGACRDICPVKINIPDLLLDLRAKISPNPSRRKRGEAMLARAYAFVMRHPRVYRVCIRFARIGQKPFMRGKGLRVPAWGWLGAWGQNREFPALARQSFTERWRGELSRER